MRMSRRSGLVGKQEEPIVINSYLTFSSPTTFTLNTYNETKNWNGTLYYSTNAVTWRVWNGISTIYSVNDNISYKIYLAGKENTYLTGSYDDVKRWVLTGSNISCNGNIESLLDNELVANGSHPTVGGKCFAYLFYNCTSLISSPILGSVSFPASSWAVYWYMFSGCTSLVRAPELPATTLSDNCYSCMFKGCTALINIPALPATSLTYYCYSSMFEDCTSLRVYTTNYNGARSFRVPSSGSGTTDTGSLTNMFKNTGGDFTTTGTININTTYYYGATATLVFTQTGSTGFSSNYGYVFIDNTTKYYSAQTTAVNVLSIVQVYVGSSNDNAQNSCKITFNGVEVKSGAGFYTLAIEAGKKYTINFTRNGTSSAYYRTATIVTST